MDFEVDSTIIITVIANLQCKPRFTVTDNRELESTLVNTTSLKKLAQTLVEHDPEAVASFLLSHRVGVVDERIIVLNERDSGVSYAEDIRAALEQEHIRINNIIDQEEEYYN